MRTQSSLRSGLLASLFLLASAGSGCKLAGSAAGSILPGEKGPGRPSPEELQVELMQLADSAIGRVDQASRALFTGLESPQARVAAAAWRLEGMRRTLDLATGPDPVLNLLDLIVGVTAARMSLEGHWLPAVWGEAARPLLEALRGIEADAWSLCERYFGDEMTKQLRGAISTWTQKHPDIAAGTRVSPPSFSAVLEELAKSGSSASSSLLGFLSLDPLSGLEPAAREVALVRQFAERALFYLQRAPRLFSDQIELELMQARLQPEWEQVLGDSQRVSLAAQSLAATAAELPAALGAEREAAVRQVSTELSAQRQGLIADLETAQAPLHAALGDARDALSAGERMSTSLNETIHTLSTFLDRFDSPAPAAGAPPPEAPDDKPFDVTEYGEAAARVGSAAQDLTALVAELDRSLPQVERTLDLAVQRGEATLDRAFKLGLGLGLVLIAAAAGAMLVVRRLGARRLAA